jgi:hypothetical protein
MRLRTLTALTAKKDKYEYNSQFPINRRRHPHQQSIMEEDPAICIDL